MSTVVGTGKYRVSFAGRATIFETSLSRAKTAARLAVKNGQSRSTTVHDQSGPVASYWREGDRVRTENFAEPDVMQKIARLGRVSAARA